MAVPQGVLVVTKVLVVEFPLVPSLQNAVDLSCASQGLAAVVTPLEPVLWAQQQMDEEKTAFFLDSSSFPAGAPVSYLMTETDGPALEGTGQADQVGHLVKEEAEKASCEAVLCAWDPVQEVQTYSQALPGAASVDVCPASKAAGSAQTEWTSGENGYRQVEERKDQDEDRAVSSLGSELVGWSAFAGLAVHQWLNVHLL